MMTIIHFTALSHAASFISLSSLDPILQKRLLVYAVPCTALPNQTYPTVDMFFAISKAQQTWALILFYKVIVTVTSPLPLAMDALLPAIASSYVEE